MRTHSDIKVRYLNILRDAAGKKEEDLELPEGSTVKMLLESLSGRGGETLRTMLFRKDGAVNPLLRMCRSDTHHLLELTDLIEHQAHYDIFIATFGG
jgi:molybdopterin converting factor small subunit